MQAATFGFLMLDDSWLFTTLPVPSIWNDTATSPCRSEEPSHCESWLEWSDAIAETVAFESVAIGASTSFGSGSGAGVGGGVATTGAGGGATGGAGAGAGAGVGVVFTGGSGAAFVVVGFGAATESLSCLDDFVAGDASFFGSVTGSAGAGSPPATRTGGISGAGSAPATRTGGISGSAPAMRTGGTSCSVASGADAAAGGGIGVTVTGAGAAAGAG